jgi:hypothetical protein
MILLNCIQTNYTIMSSYIPIYLGENMGTKEWKKSAAVCEVCEAICAAWETPGGEVRPISATFACDCDEPILRALDTETLL